MNTRLLIDLIGVDGFAALSIVLSLTPWFALLNLGLPNTTQNLIAMKRAEGRDSRRLRQAAVDAAYAAPLVYLLPALGLSVVVQKLLLPGHGNMSYASVALLVAGLVMLGLTAVFHQVLHAMHRSTWPSIAPAVQAGLTTLILTVVVTQGAVDEIWGTASVTLPILAVFLLSGRLVGARLRVAVDWRALRRMLHASRGFVVFGIAGALALSCDYIVMSRLLESSHVAQYSLASKLFGTILTLHSVLLATAWTPLSDRFFRGDFAGMRKLLLRLLCLGMVIVAVIGLPLSMFMGGIVSLLSGHQVETLPLALTASWLAFVVVRVWSDTFATALLSCHQLATMNRYVIWQSLISLLAQWVLGSWLGTPGIILGVLGSFLLTAAWILPLRFLRITRTAPSLPLPSHS